MIVYLKYLSLLSLLSLLYSRGGTVWAADEVKPIIINPEKVKKVLVGLKLQLVPTVGAKPFLYENTSIEVYKNKGDKNYLSIDTEKLDDGAMHVKNLQPGRYYIKAGHGDSWGNRQPYVRGYVDIKKDKLSYYVFNLNVGKITIQNKVVDSKDGSRASIIKVELFKKNGDSVRSSDGEYMEMWVRPGEYSLTAKFGDYDHKKSKTFIVKANSDIKKDFTFAIADLQVTAVSSQGATTLKYIFYRIYVAHNNKKGAHIWGCAENHTGNSLYCWQESNSLRKYGLTVPPGKYIITATHEHGGFLRKFVEVKNNKTTRSVFTFSLGTINIVLPKGMTGKITRKGRKGYDPDSAYLGEGANAVLLSPGEYRAEVKRVHGKKTLKIVKFKISKNESTKVDLGLSK